MLNWGLLKHPINWVTVGLMTLFAAIALHLVLSWQVNPASTTTPPK